MTVHATVPFLWVTDMERSLRYYVDGLGFEIVDRWLDGGKLRWCRLEHGGAALMLQEFWREGPHQRRPDAPLGAGVTLCFICDDALALHRAYTGRGVPSSREPFVGNGMWVTSLEDPDGYALSFESRTDCPEGTRLGVDGH
ncbi:MAG: hypothetical protein AMXMBFR53_35350 [Gemmatimonadota bacterium]